LEVQEYVSAPERCLDAVALRRLLDVVGIVNRCRGLKETLQAVVDGVVDVVGFEVAAVSYACPDGSFEVLAVAGNADAREQLLGEHLPADAFDLEFSVADEWGHLRFVPHERLPSGEGEGWVPDIEPLDVPDAWHPQDALFAPLRSPAGDLVGVLSVDLPSDRRRPGALQQQILEMFAAQAGIAIDNARLTERLHASEQAFRLAFEGAGNGMALLSLSEADRGRYLRVNAAFCRILGRSQEDLLELRFVDITHPDDRERDQRAMEMALAGGPRVYHVEKRYIHGDGGIVWVDVTSSVVEDTTGSAHYVIVQIEDITDRRAAHEELTHRVGHDDLTGLPNRRTLHVRLSAAVEAARAGSCAGALLFCDLNGFKDVNDRYGHTVGDLVLSVVGQRLAGESRQGDVVARVGGDEFALLAGDTTLDAARRLAQRLRTAIAEPIEIEQKQIRLTISVGVARIDGSRDPTELLREADADMYRSKIAIWRPG
jgi:diguanylate cyclase (GGDEF)-like protein/PAS domain S-box-containing protein